jgi:flagellar M-ring protein FliF
MDLSLEQLDYTRQMEEHYSRRVEDILTPVLGMGRVRAQVALEMDFTVAEETAERYDSKQPPGMLRSEQLMEDTSNRSTPVGIPGALSNQPPGVATVPEIISVSQPNPSTGGAGQTPPATGAQPQADASRPPPGRKEVTRNYELDKRISHTRNAPGQFKRISTAVVVDDRVTVDAAGKPVRTPLTPEELDRVTALVKEAVGFNAARGDTVNVMNATFAASPFAEDAPLPVWQQDWFLSLMKWGVIGAMFVLTLLIVARPLVRRRLVPELSQLAEQIEQVEKQLDGPPAEEDTLKTEEEGLEGVLEDRVELSGEQEVPRLESPEEQLGERLKAAQALVAEDPKRAAQVIKSWVLAEV